MSDFNVIIEKEFEKTFERFWKNYKEKMTALAAEERAATVAAVKQALVDGAASNATMTAEQVCRYYGISRVTLWRYAREGKLSPHKVAGGRRVAYLRQDVEALINASSAEDKEQKISRKTRK